jgi:hypothetical protein
MESDKQEEQSELSLEEQLAQLQAPRPIDVNIQPETAVVVITGAQPLLLLLLPLLLLLLQLCKD